MGRRNKERANSKKASGESTTGRRNWVDKAGLAVAAAAVVVAIIALGGGSGSHGKGPGKLTVVDKAV
jgi:ferric-dicitrate binding protein FerR (iron transport regulator)